MEFAKYYEVTNLIKEKLEEWNLESYRDSEIEKIFICMDTNDFWVARIYKDLNDNFEYEENSYLIERERIDKYELIEFIEELRNIEYNVASRRYRDKIIDELGLNQTKKYVIKYSDNSGLEGWDNFKVDSLEEAIDVLDDGYGIFMEELEYDYI